MSMARRLRQPAPPPITHRAIIDHRWHKQGLVVEAGCCYDCMIAVAVDRVEEDTGGERREKEEKNDISTDRR